MNDLAHINFNEIEDNFSPFKSGWYKCSIVGATWRDTKAMDGSKMLVFSFQVESGRFKGRKVSSFLNLKNKSDAAVNIATQELNKIRVASQLPAGTSSTQDFIGCAIDVDIVPDGDYGQAVGYRATNDEACSNSEPAQPSVPPQADLGIDDLPF